MKKLLRKRVGGKRHREWAWALVIVALCVVGVTIWATNQPDDVSLSPVDVVTSIPSLVTGSKPAQDKTVAGILASLPNASVFNGYVVANGLSAQLKKGTYTLFVPTNAAIATLPKGTISGLSASAQKRLVEYHIVSGKMLDNDAIISGTYQAMSRDTLNFNVNIQTGASYVNSGKVLAQYKASNGIIYLINSVLLPPR